MYGHFDPETMLLSDEFLDRYEEALDNLPEPELWVWLMHRSGVTQHIIAKKMRTNQKRVSRMLKRIQRKLAAWCIEGME